MIIKIDFYQKRDRSEAEGCEQSEAIREAILSAFDLLGDNETGGIFRDDYGLAIKDNPGQIILEVSDDTDEYTKCFVWQVPKTSMRSSGQDERLPSNEVKGWHEVEY